MLFNSFQFLVFLIVTLIVYYQKYLAKYQVLILICASLFFYAWEYFTYLFLLLASGSINIIASYNVVHSSTEKSKRAWSIGGITLNILILCFFKYSRLISDTFFTSNSDIGSFLLKIPLPIGISFFTFEGISLLSDVFKKRKLNEYTSIVPRSLQQHSQNVLLFIAFFPHLIAGPILKAHDFIPQIKRASFKDINWEYCFKHLVLGYFLKMVIADNLKDQTFWMQYPYFQEQSSLTLLTLLIGYSAQIFADFAGYSLIALGLAGLFGYRLEENFNFPYISQSFSEFWRRWHISLSTFLKEYLYIPLGGNRKGTVRTYINLLVTMFLGGLWHGAAWSYAVWGTFHGLALVIERFLQQYIRLPSWKIIKTIRIAIVFGFVTLAWLLFRLPNFNEVVVYLKAICINTGKFSNYNIITYIIIYSSPVFIFHLLYLFRKRLIYTLFFKKVEFVYYALLLFFIITNSGATGSFIYFQF